MNTLKLTSKIKKDLKRGHHQARSFRHPFRIILTMREIIKNIISVATFMIRKNPDCPIIFLDFDGVLSTDNYLDPLRATKSKTSDYWGRLFDPECISCLKRIVDETGARIVVTSSWRNYLSIWQFILMWELRKMPGILAGVTPKCSIYRGKEIAEWLRTHRNITNYIIIDDMDYLQFKADQATHLVTTNHYKGLRPDTTEIAISILKN